MATFKEMVDEVVVRLSGFGMRNDAVAHLSQSGGITSSSTSFTINTSEPVGRGVIEIDDELIWISAYDRATGMVTVPPFGRGYMGTVAASHAQNAKVTINPTFSRSDIKRDINDVIRSVGASVFAVNQVTFTASPAINTYPLPSDVGFVIGVKYQTLGPSKEWMPIRHWRVDSSADVDSFASTNSITLNQTVRPGGTVSVTYAYDPNVLEFDFDDFASTTGLPDSMNDVIILGTCHRLLAFIDPGRLTYESPESDIQSGKIQFGTGMNVAKYVFALYQQRLNEETQRQQKRYPIRVHYYD